MQTPFKDIEHASHVVDQTGELSMEFARVFRKPKYPNGRNESDSEHTLSLGWMGIELHKRFYPHLDIGKIAVRILVHDLVEVRAGDTSTLHISQGGLSDKRVREQKARQELRIEYPFASTLLDLEEEYDCDRALELSSPEDSFVFVLDKIQPCITHRFNNFEVLRSSGIDTGAKLLKSTHETTLRVERHRERVPLLCDLRMYRLIEDGRMLDELAILEK